MYPIDLAGKNGVVLGVANDRSIAWAIAQSTALAGARLVLTYQNDRLGENVRKLAPELKDPLLLPCDVQKDEEIDRLMESIQSEIGGLDFIVHALAFAPREALTGSFADTSREAFQTALDVSAYSLLALARRAAPLMKYREGSIITLTYLGSERVVPGYNVMGVAKAALEASVRYLANDLGPEGIRVNAISAGPIKTLAASGIGESTAKRLAAEGASVAVADIDDVNGKRVVRRCGVVLAAAAILALPAVVLLNAHVVDFSLRDFSMGQRVLTQFRVVVFYASVLLFPHPDRLNLIHHIATSQSIMEPLATTAAMVLILGLFVLALSLARTQRLISFCIFWFLVLFQLEIRGQAKVYPTCASGVHAMSSYS